MTTTHEAELITSFRDTFAFDVDEAEYGNRVALRTMEKHLLEQKKWPSEEELSYLRIRSAEGGGARVDRTLQLGEDGEVIAGAKDDAATDPKGAWYRLCGCTLASSRRPS